MILELDAISGHKILIDTNGVAIRKGAGDKVEFVTGAHTYYVLNSWENIKIALIKNFPVVCVD